MKIYLRWIGTIVCLGCMAGCSINVRGFGCCSGSFSMNCRSEKTLGIETPIEPGTCLKVDTASGFIKIQGRDTNVCSGEAKVCVYASTDAEAREIAEQVEIRVTPGPGLLEIRADYPRRDHVSVSVSYELTVPARTSAQVHSASGSIALSGLGGTLKADTASGSIRAEDIDRGSANLTTASGGIRIERAVLDTCYMNTASGSLICEQIGCPDIKGHTASGSIRVACVPDASPELSADLSTSSGSVQLNTPKGFAGTVELSTHSGSVWSDLPVTVKGDLGKKRLTGTVGRGSGRVSLKTASGSVKLY